MQKLTKIFALVVLLTFIAVPGFAQDKDVEIAYVEWSCATASSNVVKAVLNEEMGYDADIVSVTAAAMWQATASGDVDGFVTAWLPVTHGHYYEKVKDEVENLGPLATGAKIGLVVPEYVDIDSIADLNDHAAKFDGTITGIDPGAGIMSKSEKALDAYNLDNMTLGEGSGATMTAMLSEAVENEDWIVVTGWSPHWKFGRWDLKYLEDPKNVYGGSEDITTIVREGLEEDMPEVYAFLDRFSWDLSVMQGLMAKNQENGKPYENAKEFIKNHPELVDKWLGRS